MKILHTADIHLREQGDERWKALEELVEAGKKESIEIFAISGDLFDRGVDAERLRPAIRKVFSGTGFKIVLIPGNHDKDSYRPDLWFGEDITILTDLHAPFEHKTLRIWGMPFEHMEGEKVLHELRVLADRLTSDKTNILLYHGELVDAFFSRSDFGDEGEERYMPVKLSYFRDLNVDYVLAGHLHSHTRFWKLGNRRYFVYPGSPISITKRETGQRQANIIEVGKPPEAYPLNAPHFEHVIIEFDPLIEKDPIEQVRERLNDLHDSAKVLLTVTGFVNGELIGMNEKEIVERLKKIAGRRCVEERYEFKDIQAILEDDLVKRFMRKLETTDHEEPKKRDVLNTAIKAMIDSRR